MRRIIASIMLVGTALVSMAQGPIDFPSSGIDTYTPFYPFDLQSDEGGSDYLMANFLNTNANGGSIIKIGRNNISRVAMVDYNNEWFAGILRAGGSGTYRYAISSNYDINTSGAQFVIAGSRIGLGTMNPLGQLHITGIGSGRGIYMNPADNGYILSSFNASASDQEQFNIVHNLGDVDIYNARGIINIQPSTGKNVGIGVAAPDRKLVVDGEVGVYGSSPYLLFKNIAASNKRWDISLVGQDLYFNETGVQTGLVIEHGGNVGIGTTSPQAKLAVNGDIYAKKVKVTQSGWPDFVFAPGYSLKPLSEVEAYILKFKHLPEVPSAAEVATNDLDLGEMNRILLMKVEELTLYMIELKKENELQKQRLDTLEQLIKH